MSAASTRANGARPRISSGSAQSAIAVSSRRPLARALRATSASASVSASVASTSAPSLGCSRRSSPLGSSTDWLTSSSELSLVEVVDRAIGFALVVVEAELLVERAGRGVGLRGAEVHVAGAPLAGVIHRGLHQRPAQSLAAPAGHDVELLQVAVERLRPEGRPEAQKSQTVGAVATEQHRHVA